MTEPRVVIITGAAQGIGFGTAQCFAEQGYNVVIADMNGAKAAEAAHALESAGAKRSLGIACNVAIAADVTAMVENVVKDFGRVDVLVNNAGVCPFEHIMEMSNATWQRSLDVNLTGPYLCTRAVARHLIERKAGGSIIFITSLADQRCGPNQVDYAATKSGLRMAMAGFATALGPHGIRCNAVAPGHVNTPLTARYWDTPEGKAQAKRIIPLGHLGQPRDIGNACVYLASEQASYINGITLRVDGGHSVMG